MEALRALAAEMLAEAAPPREDEFTVSDLVDQTGVHRTVAEAKIAELVRDGRVEPVGYRTVHDGRQNRKHLAYRFVDGYGEGTNGAAQTPTD